MNKSPAFQFYPRDWIGDPEIMLMDWDARAMHLHLICIAWMQDDACAIPDNDQTLMRWLHITDQEDWQTRIKPQVFSAWKKDGDSWVQSRLKREKNKQLQTSRKRKEAAESRWSKSNANAMQVECPSSSTSSSTSLKKNNKKESFKPPTVSEVSDYVSTRAIKIDPQLFVDHYEGIGWMRGKNKIKSWQACVRTWERNLKTVDQNSGNELDLAGSL